MMGVAILLSLVGLFVLGVVKTRSDRNEYCPPVLPSRTEVNELARSIDESNHRIFLTRQKEQKKVASERATKVCHTCESKLRSNRKCEDSNDSYSSYDFYTPTVVDTQVFDSIYQSF